MKEKNKFSSRIGFILAAAGSAVGLGNLWRFPYLAAKYGGGIFLLIYLVLAVTFGFTLMLTEVTIGRKTGKSVVNGYGMLHPKSGFIGYIAGAVPVIIFPYYCVIGGWVAKYLIVYLTGNSASAIHDSYFTEFISSGTQPILFLLFFMLFTAAVVVLGVQKGIEKSSKILMPVLILLCIGIALYGLTRPGSMDGLLYYIKPDFSKFSINAVFAAMGQLFYSMSLAMGIMITYGSYMKKEDNIESCVRQIEIFDTAVAFLAGLIIVPSVFTFSGGTQASLSQGPSLMFVTLPKVFASMKLGSIIGGVFFLLVLFAALTSSISLMETIVAMIMEKTHWKRRKVCAAVTIAGIIIALPSALGFGPLSNIQPIGLSILDFFDFISNGILMPVVALLTCIFVGYVIKPQVIEEEVGVSEPFKSKKMYIVLLKYVAPVFLILILVTSILNTFGIITL